MRDIGVNVETAVGNGIMKLLAVLISAKGIFTKEKDLKRASGIRDRNIFTEALRQLMIDSIVTQSSRGYKLFSGVKVHLAVEKPS